MSNKIQLVIQAAENGNRRAVPGAWTPKSTLSEVIGEMESELVGVSLENATLRHMQIVIPHSSWSEKTLKDIGINEGGRSLLILELGSAKKNEEIAKDSPMAADDAKMSIDDDVEMALDTLLENNFDADSKTCVLTLLKIIGNVLQQPENPKVRSIRLGNAAFSKKVVERKGGLDVLLACGFQVKEEAPKLLSGSEPGEKFLVLSEENEDTALINKTRQLLIRKATCELGMKSEELPKFKRTSSRPTNSGENSGGKATTGGFNPYKGNRFDAKSAAIGKQLGPDGNYISITEKKVEELQSQQKKLEKSMQNKMTDREISAFLPNMVSSLPDATSAGSADNGPSDGTLLARQFQRREQERKKREEGGFTTKAMRDLEKLKKKKVYSHAQLRIQFSDSSAITAKFLPQEKIDVVRKVVKDSLLNSDFDFDLYVAPPRRKLSDANTLLEEGLVPAAKVFLSWKSNAGPVKDAPPGTFIKPELFQDGCKPSYPSAQALVGKTSKNTSQTSNAASTNKPSREEEMLQRMLGKGGGRNKKPKNDTSKKAETGSKPKWFRK